MVYQCRIEHIAVMQHLWMQAALKLKLREALYLRSCNNIVIKSPEKHRCVTINSHRFKYIISGVL